MGQIWEKHIHDKLKELDKYLLDDYKKIKESEKQKRDYPKYEKEFMKRLKKAIKNLEPLINEATLELRIYRGKGERPKLNVNQKLRIILIKQLIDKSNRNMAYMLDIFTMISGIDISYKTIERLYSDAEVDMALHNFFLLLLKKKNVNDVDASGDATGYSLIISKHYCSVVQKLKEKAKEQILDVNKRKTFAYQFVIIDLKTKMYVCYGTSLISERKAFDKAIQMLEYMGIKINSIRLDRYYSNPCYADIFKDSVFYIIPKTNSTLSHGESWLNAMKSFVENTINHLREYYKRENSESSFGCDKKMFGWRIMQKREDRIDTAIFCKTIWHNLLWAYSD